ncbi:hypothetical protein CKY10_12320 [Photorhabdus sp. HUG-39]|nr:hypothetical protein CKY10_12320 [Photorhabdus sp. HUG-39]
MGHTFRVADLSKSLKNNDVYVLCTHESINAFNYLKSLDIKLILQNRNIPIYQYVKKINPNLVINDTLDTDESYIDAIKNLGKKIITFEDTGSGVKKTDLTINAIYSSGRYPHVLYGHNYIDLRDEFISSNRIKINKMVKSILLSFGGEDPNNLTLRFLKLLSTCNFFQDIIVTVITGPAYPFTQELNSFLNFGNYKNIQWINNIKTGMSQHMLAADIAISSNGRTVYELAALGIPSISISANKRENLHYFSNTVGFFKLGLHNDISDDVFINSIIKIFDYETRLKIHRQTMCLDIKTGKERIIKNIIKFLNDNTPENYSTI